jgi:hypothetical protein
VYEVDGRVGRLFALTPNKSRHIELPFPIVFLDVKITYKGTTYYGLLLIRVNQSPVDDVVIYTLAVKEHPEQGVDNALIVDCLLNTDVGTKGQQTNKDAGGDIIRIFRRVVMNFNDFLEHPELKIVERKPHNNEKRVKRGKRPVPPSLAIVVKGDLKIYLDSIEPKNGESESLDKCFEVAGHWRRFRHPKFVNKQGEKTFIHPYIKGTGMPEIKRRNIPNSKLKRTEVMT